MPLITTPICDDFIVGALDLEHTPAGVRPHRLPAPVRRRDLDAQFAMVEAEPSGVRLRVQTSATQVGLIATPTRRSLRGLPARPDGIVDLIIDGVVVDNASLPGGHQLIIDPSTGETELHRGQPGTITFTDLPASNKIIELWLPHNETLELIALRSDAPIVAAPTTGRPRWVHHGSSISQGSNALRPTQIWPVVAARSAEVDLVNLGFGGSALLDPFMARVIADQPADVISLKIGINLVNSDAMRLRAFTAAVHGCLDTIRNQHPATPLLIITPLWCPIHETTPGPGAFDLTALAEQRIGFIATGNPDEVAAGKLTLQVIRAELHRIVTQRGGDDPHLQVIDGLTLYGEADEADHPLPDALHLPSSGHRLVGDRFAAHLRGVLSR